MNSTPLLPSAAHTNDHSDQKGASLSLPLLLFPLIHFTRSANIQEKKELIKWIYLSSFWYVFFAGNCSLCSGKNTRVQSRVFFPQHNSTQMRRRSFPFPSASFSFRLIASIVTRRPPSPPIPKRSINPASLQERKAGEAEGGGDLVVSHSPYMCSQGRGPRKETFISKLFCPKHRLLF